MLPAKLAQAVTELPNWRDGTEVKKVQYGSERPDRGVKGPDRRWIWVGLTHGLGWVSYENWRFCSHVIGVFIIIIILIY